MGALASIIAGGVRAIWDGVKGVFEGSLLVVAVARMQRVVIVGDGGIGKSTLLKQILALNAQEGRVPVWVSLASLPADGVLSLHSLLDYLAMQARSQLGMEEANRAFFEALIEDGALSIGFDALDEAGSLARRQKVRALIVEVAREWRRCRVFVTSRPGALEDTPLLDGTDLPKDTPVEEIFFHFIPQPLQRKDVEPFLKITFPEGETLAGKLLKRTGIDALLETPLTLSLLGLIARTKRGLPETRTPLFTRCVDTVCDTWDDAKDSVASSDGLNPEQRLDVLRRLGWAAQEASGDRLTAAAARSVVSTLPDRAAAARAKAVVTGLARRNLLLRAELSDDGSNDVQSIQFSHPQFREYLAGAHLADQFRHDRPAALAAMEPHWFDTGWLQVLYFASALLEDEMALRNDFLRAVLAIRDPYRDLIHRPTLLAARLLARASHPSSEVGGPVIANLEQIALGEPGLAEAAFSALLALSAHPDAQKKIEAFARGNLTRLAFEDCGAEGNEAGDEDAYDEAKLAALHWKLRAIETVSGWLGPSAALELTPRERQLPFEGQLAVAALHARLGDREGAVSIWKAAFDEAELYARVRIAEVMDALGETDRFNTWFRAHLDGQVTVGDARWACERKLLAWDSPIWTKLFEQGLLALQALPEAEAFASAEVSSPVYAALETDAGKESAAARRLVSAALRHPALVWFVAPRVSKFAPELTAEAVQSVTAYVFGVSAQPGRSDQSRLHGVLSTLFDEPEDRLAVPVLLELLKRLDPRLQPERVAQSLSVRGRATEAFAALKPFLEPGSPLDDPDEAGQRRTLAWQLAYQLDENATLDLADAIYRSGEPIEDARRLQLAWTGSGVATIGVPWFRRLRASTDGNAHAFLQLMEAAVGRLSADTAPIPDQPPHIETLETLEQAQSAFDSALLNGSVIRQQGRRRRTREPTPDDLVNRLSKIVSLSDEETALGYADKWLSHLFAKDEPSEQKAGELLRALEALANEGLLRVSWLVQVAEFARTLSPRGRAGLVGWLSSHA